MFLWLKIFKYQHFILIWQSCICLPTLLYRTSIFMQIEDQLGYGFAFIVSFIKDTGTLLTLLAFKIQGCYLTTN